MLRYYDIMKVIRDQAKCHPVIRTRFQLVLAFKNRHTMSGSIWSQSLMCFIDYQHFSHSSSKL